MIRTLPPDLADLLRQAEGLEQSARAHRNEAGDPHRDRNGTAAYTAQMQDQDAASLHSLEALAAVSHGVFHHGSGSLITLMNWPSAPHLRVQTWPSSVSVSQLGT